MNDRNDEKKNNNINDSNVDDIEGEEESDEESDNESVSDEEEEDNEDFDGETDDNSSSDEEIENQLNGLESVDVLNLDSEPTCYICLNLFSGQEVGSPDSCDSIHYFCLECIEEWSKQINTCPVDRKRFTYIIVRREIGSNVIMKLPIVQNIVPEVESVPEDVTFCEICGRCDREDRLLLCDGCDFGYHCECLSPPLETIPIEEWFCPDCYERLFGNENRNGLAVNPHQRRAIARTGASEAVRQRILARRTQPKKRTTKRRTRKTYRKRKTRRKTTTKTGRKRKGRRRKKRRTKKSVFASRRLPEPDARTRIASKLGIGPAPKSPFGLPSMKNLAYESIRRISDLRAAAGISNLSMFGTELDTYDPRIMTEDDIIDVGTDGVLARSRVGRLLQSPIKKSLSLPENPLISSTNTSSIDILTEIMSSQAILHSSSRDVTIGRDGSLHLNRNSVLPVRNCPNSGPSSPHRSPPSASNSPPRTESNSNSSNGFNYSFGGQTSAHNSSTSYCPEDIGSIKPLVNQLTADVEDSKLELYSDIESLGDNNNNKDDSDEEEDDQKLIIDDNNCNLKIDDNINANSAQISQSSGNSDQTHDSKDKTNNTSDTKPMDLNKNSNTNSDRPKGQKKQMKTSSKSSDAKRRPSIKDLFGDSDDEEEDDSDIRQLLAEKGSINVHYPIKMSIVLKNSINKKDSNNANVDKELINSEKQLLSNDNKESVEKSDNHLVSVESKEELSVSPSKWKSIETNETISCESDVNKWKPIEGNKDEEIVSEEVDQIEKRVKDLLTDETIDVNMSGSEGNFTELKDCDEDEMAAEEEEGEIRDDVSKVRRCRHGRIRREKNRDNKEAIVKSRQRSRSNDSKGVKRESGNNDSNSTDCVEVETNEEMKEKKTETQESEDNENNENEKIGWKKLSNTTKNRSYRDGKPKDEELLFREREVPKKLIKKTTNIKTKSKDIKETNKGSKDSDRHRDHERVKERRHDDNHNNSDAKHGRKHRSEERTIDERVRHKRKTDDILPTSGVKTKKVKKYEEKSDRNDSRRESRTRSTDDCYDREKDRRRHHHKRRKQSTSSTGHKKEESISGERGRRHHRKHSHHSKKSSNDDDMPHMMSGTTTKILRDHSSYADVTPLDSKEIYAEGDRIVINVNFKRDNKTKLESEEKSSLISDEKKTTLSETIIGHKISSKKDDTIYWASPPPTTTATPSTETQTKPITTSTITRVEDNSSVNTSKTIQKSNEKTDSALNENQMSSKKDKVIDELRFLPRSLHQTEVRPQISGQSSTTYGPHTPEGDYDENQFMPTPTQDESQSPLRSNSITSSSGSQSSHSSPTLSISKDNDVYDPEAPLQSPVDHQTVSVTSPTPQKKSVSLRTPLSPKENIKKPSPARRPPSAERLQKFSPKDIPKSSPASSSSHSIHSPFKSPSVLPQRQNLQKSSPQKPSPQKTSLMPPPVIPSIRPSVTSSIAVTAAAIASINPTNLAQLLQMAQSLKNPTQQSSQQTRQQTAQRLITNNISQHQSSQHQNHALNRDLNEVVDMDVESPSPPQISSSNRVSSTTSTTATVKTLWDQILKSTQQSKGTLQLNANKRMTSGSKLEPKKSRSDHLIPSSSTVKHQHHRHQVISVSDAKNQLKSGNKLDQLTVLDDVPSSAVEMAVKEKFIKKLNRQERVIEEVKLVLKPHYQKRTVSKEEYKEILRKSVPKICHSRSGEINPVKIKSLIEGYIKRFKYLRKKSKKLPKH